MNSSLSRKISKAKQIVLLNDNLVIRYVFRTFINRLKRKLKLDIRIYSSEDGVQGLGYIFITKPDIIIVDTTLPKYSGRELIEYLATNTQFNEKVTRVIVLHDNDTDLSHLPDSYSTVHKSDKNLLKEVLNAIVLNLNKKQKFAKYLSPQLKLISFGQAALTWSYRSEKFHRHLSKSFLLLKPFWLLPILLSQIVISINLTILRIFSKETFDDNVGQNNSDMRRFRSRYYPAFAVILAACIIGFIFLLTYLAGGAFFFSRTDSTRAASADFKVQRGELTNFGASEDTQTVFITEVDLSRAFVRLTNTSNISGGPISSTGNQNADDLGVTVELTNSQTLTFTRESSGTDQDQRIEWEVIEYIGESGGPNEFLVRDYGVHTMIDGSNTNSISVSGISDLDDVVPFLGGIRSSNSGAAGDTFALTLFMENISGDKLVVRRGTTSSDVSFGYSVVEFTGSNWTIGHNRHTYTDVSDQTVNIYQESNASGSGTSQDINNWANAFIEYQQQVGGGEVDVNEITGRAWRNSGSTTSLFLDLDAGADNVATVDYIGQVHVVSNPDMNVQWFDSGDETTYGITTDDSFNISISTVESVDQSSVFSTLTSSGADTSYSRQSRNFRLTTTSNVQFWGHRSGNDIQLAMAVVQWPSRSDAVDVSSIGTVNASVAANQSDFFTGDTFVFKANDSISLTGITFSETGTVDNVNDISNIQIFYDLDTSAPYDCASENFSGGESQFGSTITGGFTSNQASFTDSISLNTTTTLCAYVEFDIGSGVSENETINVEITDPDTDVTTSSGTVGPRGTEVDSTGVSIVIVPDMIVDSIGTTTAGVYPSTSGNYHGGAYALKYTGGDQFFLEAITFTEIGTVDGSTDISNITLRYELDTTSPYDCSNVSYSGSESQYGLTFFGGFDGANGSVTFAGSVELSTNETMCLYLEYNTTSSPSVDETIDIVIVDSSDIDYSLSPSGTAIFNSFSNESPAGESIVLADATVSSIGNQISNADTSTTNNYMGGAFVITENHSTRNVTNITLTGSGTIDNQNDVDNIKLFYENDTSAPYDCTSESYSGSESQFGSTDTDGFSGSTSGTSTFTGSVGVSQTSTLCIYAVLDIGSGATESETLELSIANPTTDVGLSSGNAGPSTLVEISGTTIVTVATNVDVFTNGSQTSSLTEITFDNYIGGNFTIAADSSRTITSIKISEHGTVDAQADLDNIKLYYELDTTSPYNCINENFAGTESQFGTTSTDGFNGANGSVNFTGSVNISTNSTMCVYVVLDVTNTSTNSETVEIQIANPSTDVISSSGTVGPGFATQIAGSTSITEIGGGGAWYSNDWKYRKKISVNPTYVDGSSNHTYIPVLVKLTSDSNLVTNAQADADDILFTIENGSTIIPHEIEFYNSSTGELSAWVKVPTLSYTQNTDLYMYYGNSASSNMENITNVWTNYEGVWHFAEDPSGTAPQLQDSTANNKDGTANGSMTTSDLVTGIAGYAYDFDDSNDYINFGDQANFDFGSTESFTVSVWFKSSDLNSQLINKKPFSGTGYDFVVGESGTAGRIQQRIRSQNASSANGNVSTGTANGQWHKYEMVINRTSNVFRSYLNGVQVGSDVSISAFNSFENTTPLQIAAREGAVSFGGQVDETRITRRGLSANWISTQYKNESSPSTFYTLGTQTFNPNLDNVNVSAIGNQTSSIDIPSTDQYIGGAFVLADVDSNRNVTGITITENGTVDALNDLDNIKLFYDLDTSAPYDCSSESYSGSESQFGSTYTDGFSTANGNATFTGSVAISKTQSMCVYVVMDVKSGASNAETLEIQITNPATDVDLSSGIAGPNSVIAIPSTTSLQITGNTVDWQTGGTQTSTALIPSTNQYVGGYFYASLSSGTSTTIDSVTIREQGTVDGSSDLSNIKIFFENDTSSPYDCASESYAGTESQYGSNDVDGFSAANGTSTFSGSATVSSTSTPCFYVVLDVENTATSGQTLDIDVANPYTDIILNAGTVSPATPVSISGSTSLETASISISSLGSQNLGIAANYTNEYIGGAFVISESNSSKNVTGITITETGSVNASTGLDNIKLFYESDISSPYDCSSESYAGTETQFGSTDTDGFSSANGTSIFSDSVGVSPTSSLCIYVVLDTTGSVSAGQIIDLSIEDPQTDVSISGGYVSTISAVELANSTVIYNYEVDVNAIGSQTSSLNIPSSNQYIGGAFAIKSQIGSRTVTGVTIREQGTVDGQNSLDNIKLLYELDTTEPYDCTGESYDAIESQFGSTDSDGFSSSNGTSSFTDSVIISETSALCIYPVLDITASASNGESIDIDIAETSTDVVVSSGNINPESNLAITGSTTLSGVDTSWFNDNWRYRKEITIESDEVSGTGTLTNFPFLVRFTDSDLATYAKDNGNDLLFVDENGNKLNHEIDNFDGATGSLEAWVLLQNLDATTDSTIYIYFGNDLSVDQQRTAQTWPTAYKGVWHLNEDPETSGQNGIIDSTINQNNGTSEGTMTGSDSVSGVVGNGIDFDGVDDAIKFISNPNLDVGTNDFSLSAWVKTSATPSNILTIAAKGAESVPGFEVGIDTNAYPYSEIQDNTGNTNGPQGTTTVNNSQWRYLVWNFDRSGNVTAFVDGSYVGTMSISSRTNTIDHSSNFYIARNNIGGFFPGSIDEMRLRIGLKTADQITTEFDNQKSTSVSSSVGSIQQQDFGWYNNSWLYRKEIVINSNSVEGSGSHTDFPVLISLSDLNIATGAQTDGDDILFTSDNGTTKLDHEIIDYVSTNGALKAWVEVSSLSTSTDTSIYLYYGNSVASNQENVEGVWGTNYAGIYHLSEGTGNGTTYFDSTSNSNDGTFNDSNSNSIPASTCKIYLCIDFNGDSDHVNLGQPSTLNFDPDNDEYTISAWVSPDSGGGAVVTKGGGTSAQRQFYMNIDANLPGSYAGGVSNDASLTTPNSEWSHVQLINYNDSGTFKSSLYVNGVQDASIVNSGSATNALDVLIGVRRNTNNTDTAFPFDGKIEEVRFSSTDRSAGWIATEYNNQNSPSSFINLGAEELGPDTASGTVVETEEAWYNLDWSYRKSLTIYADQIEGSTDFANFPVYFELNTDTDLASYAQSDGDDILFTSNDGLTKLDHEIQSFNESTGQLKVWIKIPVLSPTINTNIYMYYGNGSATNQEGATSVWSDYLGVWHFEEDPSTSSDGDCGGGTKEMCDSTGNNADGDSFGSMTTSDLVTGVVGNAINFDGSNDYFNLGNVNNITTDDFAISFWFRTIEDSSGAHIIAKGANGGPGYRMYMNPSFDRLGYRIQATTGTASESTPGSYSPLANNGNWQYTTFSYDRSGSLSIYINGDFKFSLGISSLNGLNLTTTDPLYIGRAGFGQYWDGDLDEMRLSTGLKTADQIGTEYNNQNSPSTFIGISESTSTADWYDSDWLNRQKITVSSSNVSGSGNLTNFPMLVNYESNSLLGSNSQSNGNDILFTASDGTTKLDHEIEYYNSSNGELQAWVKVPALQGSANTDIYMYYGNSGASSQQNPTGVWDSNYLAVWHMNNNPAGSAPQILDSTSNNRDLTSAGSWGSGNLVQTELGQGINSPGTTDQEFRYTTATWLNGLTSQSISIYSKSDVTNSDRGILTSDEAAGDSAHVGFRYDAAGFAGGGSNVAKVIDQYESANGIQTTNYQHIVYNWTASTNLDLYLDGSLDTPTNDGGDGLSSTSVSGTFLLGDHGNASNWDGIIDEVRISNITRSQDWIVTERNNLDNPSDFIQTSSEETYSTSWYNDQWSYRKPITINESQISGSTALTNFPVLVKISSDSDLASKAQNDSDDILFTSVNGTTKLSHEIEGFDGSTGELRAWVNIPSLSATADTIIYMYFGNETAPNQEDVSNVWTDYEGVWHFEDDPLDEVLTDSSINNYDGSVNGTMGTSDSVSGVSGSAYDFDGIDDYIEIGDQGNLDFDSEQSLTLSAWFKSSETDNLLINKKALNSTGYQIVIGQGSTAGRIVAEYEDISSNTASSQPFTGTNDSNWHMVASTINRTSDELRIFGDGAQISTAVSVSSLGSLINSSSFQIAGRGGSSTYTGQIDEVRVSSIARSSDWIAAEYSNINAPGSFTTIGTTETSIQSWYNYDWLYRKSLTIDYNQVSGGSNITNFIALVSTTDTDLTAAQADGDDILFADQLGNKLDHEIESYNNSTGELVAWVKIPNLLVDTNTIIYLYYGNPSVTSQQNSSSLWSDYRAVWHMNNDPSGSAPQLLDSTTNSYDATSSGSMTSGDLQTAKIGQGISFDGSDDYFEHNSSLDTSSGSMSVWVNPQNTSTEKVLLYHGNGTGGDNNGYGGGTDVLEIDLFATSNTQWQSDFQDGDSNNQPIVTSTGQYATDNWYLVSYTWDKTGSANLYVNGSSVGSNDLTDTTFENIASTVNLIGAVGNKQSDRSWDGIMDEARLSDSVLSSDWITTEYNNQTNPTSFMTIGSEEEGNSTPIVSNVEINKGLDINLTENTTTPVEFTANVTDIDRYTDLQEVEGRIYRSGVTSAENCTLDNNNCYEDAVCSLNQCSGNTCAVTCSVDVQFHAEPTDIGTYSAQSWETWIQAIDSENNTASAKSSANVDLNTLRALDVQTTIDYGTLEAGEDTGAINQTTTITNTGNAIIDVEISGEDFCSDFPECIEDTFNVNLQEYSTGSFTFGLGSDVLKSPNSVNISIAKPTNNPSSQTGTIYWGLGLPNTLNIGAYSSNVYIIAIGDS